MQVDFCVEHRLLQSLYTGLAFTMTVLLPSTQKLTSGQHGKFIPAPAAQTCGCRGFWSLSPMVCRLRGKGQMRSSVESMLLFFSQGLNLLRFGL